ncbi:MAG: hypothetical protein ACE5GR_02900 [Nitrosopumilus sp.]
MISKIILSLLSVIIVFQAHQVFGDEELLPIITVDFVSGNVIDLDENPQMIRADVRIQNYNPQDGYHFMQVTKLSDGEIIKNTEIIPKAIAGAAEDNVFGVQILHYLDPDVPEETLLGDYELRIYSEFGVSENISTFSIIKSSLPTTTQNTIEELVTPEEELESKVIEESKIENLEQSESQIPSWVHDIFVWYANETISENELLAALEYLISQGTIKIDSN